MHLLRQKQDQNSLVINSVSNDGLNALDYALIDSKNVDVVSFLIVNQINVSPYAINKIEEYSISLEDKELLDYYQGLYTRLIPSDFRYLDQKIKNKVEEKFLFSKLPVELIVLIVDEPAEIYKLYNVFNDFNHQFCKQPTSRFWLDLYRHNFNEDPKPFSIVA